MTEVKKETIVFAFSKLSANRAAHLQGSKMLISPSFSL